MDQQFSRLRAQARIVVTTCAGSGMDLLSSSSTNLSFSMLIIDEATQSSEPSTLIPVHRAGQSLERLVLIGDHQ